MAVRSLRRPIVCVAIVSTLAAGRMATAQSFDDAPVGGAPEYGGPQGFDDGPVGGAPVYDEGPMFDPTVGGTPLGGPAGGEGDGPVGGEPVY